MAKAKRHQGHPRKGTKAKKEKRKKGSTFYFRLKKKKSPQKAKKKQKKARRQLSSLRSTQCKTHCNANGMRCDLHRHEITSINDKKYINKLTLMFKNVQSFAHFVMIVGKFRTFTVFLRWIRRRKSQKFPLATIVIHN